MEKSKAVRFSDGRRFFSVAALLAALLLLGLALNIYVGSIYIAPAEIMRLLWDALGRGAADILSRGASRRLAELAGSTTSGSIILRIRLPRVLLAAVLGGGLSVSGYLLQAFFRNPVAGPFVLGISSGARMAVGITMVFLSAHIGRMGRAAMILAAFAGSLAITGAVLLFSRRMRSMPMLLVTGIMIGYICGAVTDFCVAFASEQEIAGLTGWSMGSFSGADWDGVAAAAAVCVPASAAAWLLSKPIAAYAMGEGYAKSLGVNTGLFRAALIAVSSLLSACVTALAGPVSFVGVAAPHIARSLLKSSKPAFAIPATFLCGAVFCVFCDLIARTVFAPTELQIGTVTSVFGAPVVVCIMVKRGRMGDGRHG